MSVENEAASTLDASCPAIVMSLDFESLRDRLNAHPSAVKNTLSAPITMQMLNERLALQSRKKDSVPSVSNMYL